MKSSLAAYSKNIYNKKIIELNTIETIINTMGKEKNISKGAKSSIRYIVNI